MTPSRSRYLLAGAAYAIIGSSVMALTAFSPGLAAPERRADLMHLLVALPFFLLFAAAIVWGHRAVAALVRLFGAAAERAERIGFHVREKLVMVLAVTSLGRIFVFISNGLGYRPRWLDGSLRLAETEPAGRMLLAAALMALLVAALVWAAWVPFLARRR
ncbi:MAG: hypothetical protein AAF481_00535 [Acidobacteriota bacterium]